MSMKYYLALTLIVIFCRQGISQEFDTVYNKSMKVGRNYSLFDVNDTIFFTDIEGYHVVLVVISEKFIYCTKIKGNKYEEGFLMLKKGNNISVEAIINIDGDETGKYLKTIEYIGVKQGLWISKEGRKKGYLKKYNKGDLVKKTKIKYKRCSPANWYR